MLLIRLARVNSIHAFTLLNRLVALHGEASALVGFSFMNAMSVPNSLSQGSPKMSGTNHRKPESQPKTWIARMTSKI
jgi:hypothetical protein